VKKYQGLVPCAVKWFIFDEDKMTNGLRCRCGAEVKTSATLNVIDAMAQRKIPSFLKEGGPCELASRQVGCFRNHPTFAKKKRVNVSICQNTPEVISVRFRAANPKPEQIGVSAGPIARQAFESSTKAFCGIGL
jgi:hypothetical protein